MSILEYHNVGFRFDAGGAIALHNVSLEITDGEFVLVIGSSGSGKSTLLRAANGIVPHTTGGEFSGEVTVADRSTRFHKPRELIDAVGFVHQDPEAQFVVDQVEADIAFALENLGLTATAMRRRVEEVLDALGIAHLRDRSPATLSGGERQRVAIAGAVAAAPRVLVCDEPTSQLDPQGAEDVLGAIARLNADLGTTILIAEHRLDRCAPLADRAIIMQAGSVITDAAPGRALADYPGAPPVTQLAHACAWPKIPLTVKEARGLIDYRAFDVAQLPAHEPVSQGTPLIEARAVTVQYGARRVLGPCDLTIAQGEIIAVIGRNGAGKSTLLRAIAGLISYDRGEINRTVAAAYIPQDPNSLFSAPTAREEIAHTLRLLRIRDTGQTDTWLDRLGIAELAHRHPRSLSGGERQRLAIATVAVGGAPVLLADEPTRGMDAQSRRALERAFTEHTASGGAVVLATHDVELAARVATRVIVIGDGEIVADGTARSVLEGSLFAPQILRVIPPLLTVDEALAARR